MGRHIRIILVAIFWLLASRTAAAQGQIQYVVQPGDTLYGIAVRYDSTVSEIAQANNLLNPNFIVVGQSLVIPGAASEKEGQPSSGGSDGAQATSTERGIYTVRPGDTLYQIAVRHGVTLSALAKFNALVNPNIIYVGQLLRIPSSQSAGGPEQGAPAVADVPEPAPAGSANLLPNSSFEEGWYFAGFPELQVPNHWTIVVDEGANTLTPGSGGSYSRPEVRVIPYWELPEYERSQFVLEGQYTVKAFKGGLPSSFRLTSELTLNPGRYRLTTRFFADTVAYWQGGAKVWPTDPLYAEVKLIAGNRESGWQTVTIGQQNEVAYDFSVDSSGPIVAGAAFRNRFEAANNGWFLDNWSLVKLDG